MIIVDEKSEPITFPIVRASSVISRAELSGDNDADSLVTEDLIQWLESSDFDGSGDGTDIHQWTDKTGLLHHMTHGVGNAGGISGSDISPTVDQTRKLNGHATVRFGGNQVLVSSAGLFIPPSGLTGLEIIVIYKLDANPPPAGQGSVFSYQRTANIFIFSPFFIWVSNSPNQPVGSIFAGVGTTGHWMEPFANGTDQTLMTGNLDLGVSPIDPSAGFAAYNLAAAADGSSFKAWMNSNNFASFGMGQYTFRSRGTLETTYTLGGAINYGLGGSFNYTHCNIAGLYLWSRRLTNDERAQVRRYLANLWGIAF